MKDEIKIGIDQIPWANESEKIDFVRLSNNACDSLKAKVSKKTIVISDGDGRTLELVERKTKKPEEGETSEKIINRLNIDENIKKDLKQKAKTGHVNQNQLKMIKRLDGDISKLSNNRQQEIVDNIITSQKESTLILSEEIASSAIQDGYIDANNADKWYKNILRLISNLKSKIEINDQVISFLGDGQREFLSEQLRSLNTSINILLKKLKTNS